ncbi:hypothetical protein ANME2D_03307 [Candidatus Methanoperedens nitroreducens]|uniref:Uncharacterized protein n=2 Tax=Candidatus Methanoperedens nitratireducens TaxID=1392998 RepID=A0A062UZ10_9EURY|nr:hypothetical protein ANME2D_03307 [Candidatus Methanoperedens nitroreducens]
MINLSVKRGRFSVKVENMSRKRCPECGSSSIFRRTRNYSNKTKYRCQKCKLNFDVPVIIPKNSPVFKAWINREEKMITKQELIEELKEKEAHVIKKELQERLLKKWENDGKPLECGCGKELQDISEEYKQIQNNLFETPCGKKRKLKIPARYDAVQILKQLMPWIAWDENIKSKIEIF